jgi:hypothetical protein
LTRSNFDLDSVIGAAEELKYVGQIKREIAKQFTEPTDDWVKFFTSRVYEGSFTARVREQFTPLVLKASTQFLNDQTSGKLKAALGDNSLTPSDVETKPEPEGPDVSAAPVVDIADVVTTEEELQGFEIVRAIACMSVKPGRIVHRDAKSYFAILLDNNNRKSVARLHFNTKKQRYVSLFDAEGVETRVAIGAVEEIYEHAGTIRARVEALIA